MVLYDHSFTPLPDTYGQDYLAGGPGDDVIFGQLGDDTIQGDGEVELFADPAVDVSARRIYSYTANTSFDGIDSFAYSYTVFDSITGKLDVRSATVTITTLDQLTNYVPSNSADDVLVITEDGSGGYNPIYFAAADLLANDGAMSWVARRM